jgi:CxxC-x17-CxxC domain-containing protein
MGDFRPRSSGGFSRDRPRSGGFGNRGGFGGSRGGSRGGFGGGRGGFGGERRPLEMHDVTCDKCHKQCQVPFRPSGDKPVYCSACFESNGGGSRPERRDSRPSNSQPSISPEQINQINAKLDKIIKILNELEVVHEDEEEILDDEVEDEEEISGSSKKVILNDQNEEEDLVDEDESDDEVYADGSKVA